MEHINEIFKTTFMEKSHLKIDFYLNIFSSISFTKKKSIVIVMQYIPLLLSN
jgi:hypothetical protein